MVSAWGRMLLEAQVPPTLGVGKNGDRDWPFYFLALASMSFL